MTVECNPEDADEAHLGAYRAAGVTRVSFGLQSTNAHVLAGLGRRHVPDAAARIAAAVRRAGYGSWNLDLIFGGAGETDDDWRGTLAAVLALPDPPPHISAYALTVEPGTPLSRTADRHPDDDTLARRYELTDEILSRAGYGWEEISNWALPGHRCRHNQLYWEQGDYVGIGSAAHSHRHGVRWWNIRTPDRYIDAIAGGPQPGGRPRGAHRRAAGLRGALAHAAHATRGPLGRPHPRRRVGRARRPPRRPRRAHRPRPAAGQRGHHQNSLR